MIDKKPGKRGSLRQRLTRTGRRQDDGSEVASAARPYVELLEARVLYSADPLVVLTDPADFDSNEFTGELIPYSLPGAPLEIVFINDDVGDLSTLMHDLHKQIENGRRLEVHLLDSSKPGFDQIGQIIKSAESIAAVHIISHGNAEGVQLGGEWLSNETVHQHQDALAAWQPALLPQTSLHIYGCDLAATDNGVALLNNLAAYTGTEVLASDDKTGHASLQADWDLEYSTGVSDLLEALISDSAQATWFGTLAAPTLGDGTLSDINEDASVIAGETVAGIFTGQFSGDGSFAGIAIAVDATTTEGLWQYSTDNGSNWHAIGAVTADAALLLDTSSMLRFVPAPDSNGPVPQLTIYGIDNTYAGAFSAGAAAETGDVTVRGGSSPFAALSATINSTVNAINDAPVLGTGSPVDIVMNDPDPDGDTIATIFAGQFSDVDAGSAFGGVAVVNDASAGEGVWEYSTDAGSNWYPIGSVSASAALMLDVNSVLRFVPVENYAGPVPALTVHGADNTAGPYTTGATTVTEDVTLRGGVTPFAHISADIASSVLTEFTPNDDDLGAVLSGDALNFNSLSLTDNDVYKGAHPPTILSTTTPTLGALATSGSDYIFSSSPGDSGVSSFDYVAMDGSPDLISQWQLNSDGSDDMAANNGVVTTDSSPGTLVFDGNDYVEIANFAYPSSFTLMFEFRVGDLDNNNEESLFAQGKWQRPNYLGIWINGEEADSDEGHLVTEIYDETESDSYTPYAFDVSGAPYSNGGWHSYAIVVEQGVGHSVYIDGELKHSSGRADAPFTPAGPAYFGAEEKGDGLGYYLENHGLRNARLYTGTDVETIERNELTEFSTGTATITVRNEESLDNNNTIEVTEDQPVTVTDSFLLTTDDEQSPSELIYEILLDANY